MKSRRDFLGSLRNIAVSAFIGIYAPSSLVVVGRKLKSAEFPLTYGKVIYMGTPYFNEDLYSRLSKIDCVVEDDHGRVWVYDDYET